MDVRGRLTDLCSAAAGALSCPLPPWGEPDEGRGERRDAAANRQRILAVARDLFAAQGVDQVTMHEIAKATGIGQGTLYRRYAHKGLLCMALIDEGVRQFHADLTAHFADDDAPALDQLDFFLVRLAAFMDANAPLLGAMADAACGDRRDADHANPFAQWLHGTVATLIERGVARGEIAPLDIAPAADIVLAPLTIDLYLHLRRGRGYSPDRLLATVRQVVFAGLRAERT